MVLFLRNQFEASGLWPAWGNAAGHGGSGSEGRDAESQNDGRQGHAESATDHGGSP